MRYLSFNAIAKRCPKGQWKDEKSGRCVSIEEWKKLNYKYLQDNEGKERTGRCPKGKWKDPKTGECVSQEEWKKRNYKNYKPKEETDTDPKEEKNPEVEPYEDGIAKPESLKYVMGVTRKEILKDHPEYFEQVKETAKSVRDKLNDDSVWSDDSHTTAWKIKETLAPFDEYGGIEVSDNLKKISAPVIKSILSDFVDTFEEYPYAMASFGGFTTINENTDCSMWCSYSEDRQIGIKVSEYSSMEKSDEDYEGITKISDPIAGGERTDWGFHFKGSTGHSCISHEWGHACDIALFSMRVRSIKKERNKPIPNSIYDQSLLNNLDVNSDMGGQIRADFSEMGYRFRATKPYGKNYGNAVISLDGADEYDMEKIKGYLKDKGYKMQEVKKYWGEIECKLVPLEEDLPFNLNKLEYSDRKELRIKSRIASRQSKSLWKEMDNYSKRRVKECEELYKELYDTEILPSECYTRYGYYGAGRRSDEYYSGKKANLTESASQERLAEAMEDVMIRKDKANSMSQLLVAHIEYEYYQLITGKYELSFNDFIKNEVGLDRFKDRIIKSPVKYLLFNSIAKRCPNGKRFDDETNTCIPKEEWEAKHHHDYTKNPKQEQPKRKVDIASQSFVKVDKGTPEYKMIKNLKVGNSDEAKASRKAVIDFYNKRGWIPKIDVEPFKVNGTTFDGTKTTYTLFTTEDGKYTPERQEVHKQIIKKIMDRLPKPPTDRKPIVLFTGGGSASGKGSMDETLAKKMGIPINIKPQQKGESDEDYRNRKSRVYDKLLGPYKIDPDAIMELIPEYEEYVKHDMIGGASVFHKEASDIAKMVFDMALAGGYDFIYDGTFSSQKAVKMAKKIDRKKYDTHLIGKLTDVDICKQRSGKRFINGGKDGKFPRIVPNKVLESTNNGFREIYQSKDIDNLFDSVTAIEDSQNKKK